MRNLKYKSIAYAYPSSENAKRLGFEATGCWHIEQTIVNIDGSGKRKTYLPDGAKGFSKPDDPNLISELLKTAGEPHADFLRYGNPAAMHAFKIACQIAWDRQTAQQITE